MSGLRDARDIPIPQAAAIPLRQFRSLIWFHIIWSRPTGAMTPAIMRWHGECKNNAYIGHMPRRCPALLPGAWCWPFWSSDLVIAEDIQLKRIMFMSGNAV